MKIYLAARYSRFPELQAFAAQLSAAGHQVTSRWIEGDHQISVLNLSGEEQEALRTRFAFEHMEDLMAAQCCVSFTEPPRAKPSRGGPHVEFGCALALGHRVIVVGPRENVFHSLDNVEHYETPEEALAVLCDPHYVAWLDTVEPLLSLACELVRIAANHPPHTAAHSLHWPGVSALVDLAEAAGDHYDALRTALDPLRRAAYGHQPPPEVQA